MTIIMLLTVVPWKVDKNKTAMYFDSSHQVTLILDWQKFTPCLGYCQSPGFNESHSQPLRSYAMQTERQEASTVGWMGKKA